MRDNLTSKNAPREYCLALQRVLQRTSNPKLGLARAKELLHLVGFERSSLKVIQVVGTNGKGSTVAFIEAILKERGVTCGLFTSPHLCTARERIRINGEMVSEIEFVEAADHVLAAAQQQSDDASFFECILAMAMWLFQKHGVQVAILEAGLGGRLDATTAVQADILGISSIDLDHQNILGSTLEQIAREKIGAARSGQMVVSVAQSNSVHKVLEDTALAQGFHLKRAGLSNLPLGLFGEHQRANAGLAHAIVKDLRLAINDEHVARGFRSVNWPGRFEVINNAATIVLDGAHNPAGIRALVKSLKAHEQFAQRPLVVVYGSLAGHNALQKIEEFLNRELALKHVYLHQPKNPRAMLTADLHELFVSSGFDAKKLASYDNMEAVKTQALTLGASIVVCGSLYTIGEIRGELLSIAIDGEAPNF